MNLASALSVLLSDVVSLYFRAHGYHWNVEGPDFSQYHALFGEIYEDIYGSIDPIAENIRKVGAYAPFELAAFSSLRTLQDVGVDSDPASMTASLLAGNEQILVTLDAAFKAAVSENQQGIANFLSERDDMHRKWSWQLRSSLA